MTTYIDNPRSSISRSFLALLPPDEPVSHGDAFDVFSEHFLFCGGYLAGKSVEDISVSETALTWHENYEKITIAIDDIIERNPLARIVVMGSYSAIKGSYDATYAAAKLELHRYVETKQLLHREQQLVAIAPTVISDSGMTQRRKDIAECLRRGAARRRGRWLEAMEVARLAHFILFEDQGSLCNVVIPVTGGNS